MQQAVATLLPVYGRQERWLNLKSYFYFGPTLKKSVRYHNPQLSNLLCKKVTDSDFAHSFEDGTKLKIPSEIQQPLAVT